MGSQNSNRVKGKDPRKQGRYVCSMRCQNLSMLSMLGLVMGSQCQSGIKRHSQRRAAYHEKPI